MISINYCIVTTKIDDLDDAKNGILHKVDRTIDYDGDRFDNSSEVIYD